MKKRIFLLTLAGLIISCTPNGMGDIADFFGEHVTGSTDGVVEYSKEIHLSGEIITNSYVIHWNDTGSVLLSANQHLTGIDYYLGKSSNSYLNDYRIIGDLQGETEDFIDTNILAGVSEFYKILKVAHILESNSNNTLTYNKYYMSQYIEK